MMGGLTGSARSRATTKGPFWLRSFFLISQMGLTLSRVASHTVLSRGRGRQLRRKGLNGHCEFNIRDKNASREQKCFNFRRPSGGIGVRGDGRADHQGEA